MLNHRWHSPTCGTGEEGPSCIIDIDQETEMRGGPVDPILSEITSRMTREEKLALVAELKAAIADEMASDALAGADGRAGACPRCGCGRSVRKGRGRSGEQRWLCRGAAGPGRRRRSGCCRGRSCRRRRGWRSPSAWPTGRACARARGAAARRCARRGS